MDLLGPEAWRHRDELEEVKARIGIEHDKFDCWIFKFLENKHFDVDETVAKLQRRAEMERGFLSYEVTDHMRDMMRSGIMQVIGEDKEGRMALYVVTARDKPKASLREQRKQNFDMWLSYASRLRRNNPTCRITMLVNQKDAGVWANTDMTFQTNIAFRIAKFYPGMIDRAYVCCMGNALSTVARPIIRAMPAVISDRIFIYSEKHVFEEEKLLEFFDKSVLPVGLGGENDCDNPENWHAFADNVEGYFAGVKDALNRGMSVKEYEQSILDDEERLEAEKKKEEERVAREQAAESVRTLYQQSSHQHLRRRRAQSQQNFHQQHRRQQSSASPVIPVAQGEGPAVVAGGAPDETVSVFTCESESFVPPRGSIGRIDELSGSIEYSHYRMSGALALAPENIARHLEIVESLLRMEEQEALFRQSFYGQHEQYLHEFSNLYLTSRAALAEANEGGADPTNRLAMQCPHAARSATRGLLLTLCVAMSILFLAATVFILLCGSTMTTVLFISIFIDNVHVFPIGMGILILGHQCGLVGSRGFELTTSSVRGTLMRPLTRLNNTTAALLGQFAFFVIVILIVLGVFIAFASMDNPLEGLRTALGSGMYACAIVLGIYHILFPFGLSPEKKRRSKNQGGLSLYLFLDITEDREARAHGRAQTSALILVSFPAVVAVLFGACFMITPSLFFIIATVTTTLGSAFTVNHFVGGNHRNLNGNILRATTWILCLYWIITTFTIGFVGFVDGWQDTILGSSAVAAYFVVITAVCYFAKEGKRLHRYMFRLAYISCLLLALIGVAMMFYVAWAFGLVMGVLLVHSFMSFLRPSSTAAIGTAVFTFTTLVIALTVVLYAFQITTYSDTSTQLPVTRAFVPPSELPHPVCLQHWGSDDSSPNFVAGRQNGIFAASDLALLNRLSYNRNTSVINGSLAVVFPGMRLIDRVETPDRLAILCIYHDITRNLLVASVVPDDDRMGAITGVTMWAEGIGLQPYGNVLPTNWTSAVVDSVSYLTNMFPHRYRVVIRSMRQRLGDVARSYVGGASRRVVLTGHSLGGGIASILGAQMSIPTVAFEAPGLLLSKNRFEVTEWQYLKYVTVINTPAPSLSNVDSHGPALQSVTCPHYLIKCSQPGMTFCLLQSICGSSGNRSLVECGGAGTHILRFDDDVQPPPPTISP